MKTSEGKEILTRLLETADIFVENLHPGAVDKLGFSWEDVHRINPRVIYGTIKGFNDDSPLASVKAFEPVAQCAGGAAATTGWWKGEYDIPTQSGAALGDSNTGMHLLIGLLAALMQREKTGEGCFVQQSMQDAVINLCRVKLRDQLILEHTGVLKHMPQYPDGTFTDTVPRGGNVEGGQVLGWCYRCKGWDKDPSAFVYIVLQNEVKPFAAAAKAIGKPEWVDDPKFNTPEAREKVKEEIYAAIEAYTITREKMHIVEELGKLGVPCGPVLSMKEIAEDESLRKCGTIVEVDQPGRGKFLTIGCPPKFSSYTPEVKPAPALGEHTDEVLKEIGYTPEEIQALRNKHIVCK
jgi:formyl-CoA transferase